MLPPDDPTERQAVDAKRLPVAVVGLDEGADGEAPRWCTTTREEVPIPPLKSWQIIPVPPPTLPSATGPGAAASSAALDVLRP